MIPIQSPHPPGTVGVVSASSGRFDEFSVALAGTLIPLDTQLQRRRGVNLARNWNLTVEAMHGEWLWCLNDDHAWEPELLMRLLDHDVDVVVPLTPNRHAPYPPVVTHGPFAEPRLYDWDELGDHKGLVRLPDGDWVGHAGMLIRKRVFELVPAPWFEVGQIESDCSTLDTWFCQKLLDHNIPIHVDVDSMMDHLIEVRLRPARNADGKLRPHYQPMSRMDVACKPQ